MKLRIYISNQIKADAENPVYRKALAKFIQGESGNGLNLEKLQAGKGYSLRVNQTVRLILIPKKIANEQAWLWVMSLLDHDYKQLAQKSIAWFENLLIEDYVDNTTHAVAETLSTEKYCTDIEITSAPVFYFIQQWIVLDAQQAEIQNVRLPALVSGGPGTGKSCVSLAKILQNLQESTTEPRRMLWVTASEQLVQEMKKNWSEYIESYASVAFINSHNLNHIEFKTTREVFFENRAVSWGYEFFSEAEITRKQQLINYLAKAKQVAKQKHLDVLLHFSLEELYQEIRALAGYNSLKDYQQAVGKHSLLPNNQAQAWLWEMYYEYQSKRDDFKKLYQGELQQYDLIVLDEAQDLWRLEIKLVMQLAKNQQIFYCVGDHQNLYDSEFIVPFIKSLHWQTDDKMFSHHLLQSVYRCPHQVVDFANKVLELSDHITGYARYQTKQIAISEINREMLGEIFWLQDLKKLTSILQTAVLVAVIFPEQFSEEYKRIKLQELFGNKVALTVAEFANASEAEKQQVCGIGFTTKEIKGLGFKNVLVYEPLSHDSRFSEANQVLKAAKLDTKSSKESQFIHLRPAFNTLFVSITRAMGNLLIYQAPLQSLIQKDKGNVSKLIETFCIFIKELKAYQMAQPTLSIVTGPEKNAEIAQVEQRMSLVNKPATSLQMMTQASASSSYQAKPITKKNLAPKPSSSYQAKKSPIKVSCSGSPIMTLKQPTIVDACHAMLSNDFLLLKKVIEQNPQLVQVKIPPGITLLQLATNTNQLDMVKLLIAQGADVNAIGLDGKSALHLAAEDGRLAIMQHLVEHQADVHQLTTGASLATPLALTAEFGHWEAMEYLISQGADINVTLSAGGTPLFSALQKNHIECVKLLLAKGAKVGCKLHNGADPLHLAIQLGFFDIVELLLTYGADVNGKAQLDIFPLYLAVQNRHFDIVKLLLAQGADINQITTTGDTALHSASFKGYVEIVELLLAVGINLNNGLQTIAAGFAPIHYAAQEGHIEIVRLLLAHGADVNCQVKEGMTALHIATKYSNYAVVEMLLANKAEVNCVDQQGDTPLHLAVKQHHLSLVKLLVENKADIHFATAKNLTPVMLAQKNSFVSINYYFETVKKDSSTQGSSAAASIYSFFIATAAAVQTTAAETTSQIHLGLCNSSQ